MATSSTTRKVVRKMAKRREEAAENAQEPFCLTETCTEEINDSNKLHRCTGAELETPHWLCRICLDRKTNDSKVVHHGKEKHYQYTYPATFCPICQSSEGAQEVQRRPRAHIKDANGKDTEEFLLDKNGKFIYLDDDSEDEKFRIGKGFEKGDRSERRDGGGGGVC